MAPPSFNEGTAETGHPDSIPPTQARIMLIELDWQSHHRGGQLKAISYVMPGKQLHQFNLLKHGKDVLVSALFTTKSSTKK